MPEPVDWKHEIRRRLELKLAPAREQEITEELAQHLEDEYRRLLTGGATAEEAREIALDGIGGVWLREKLRRDPVMLGTPGGGNFAADMWHDLRYAARMLRKSPGFTAVAVVSLALGIGGNAAIFSIVNTVLIRPLAYPDPGRLVRAANDGYYPPGGLAALQERSRAMEAAGYITGVNLNLTGQGEALRLTGSMVSANFFTVLGARVELGRLFGPGEDLVGHDSLAILSHTLWRGKFNGDPGIIGRVIALGGGDRQVVGVMGPGFSFPDAATQFWIPLHRDPRDAVAYWARGFMPVFGRLRAGVTLEQAQSEIRALTHQMIAQFPYPMGRDWNAQATVLPLQQFLVSDIRSKLIVLQCAVGLVLLIACVNIASLLLARATSRQKEMALRAALGAARGRIARQLLTESVALSLVGGALGMGLAAAALSVLKLALPPDTAGLADIQIGWRVAAFAGALAVATGVAFGLVPALGAIKLDLTGVIKTGGQRATGTAKARLRSALVMGEVGLAVVLAVGAGLLIRSLWKLTQVNPGFQPQSIYTLRVTPNEALCRERESCIGFYDELLRRTAGIPGVLEATAANTVPMSSEIPAIPVVVEGHPYVPAVRVAPMMWSGAVAPSYFRVMRIPILAGRTFAASDGEKAAPVIIVSASMAGRYWPGQNPIGKHIRAVFENKWRTVVGVSGDVRQYDLADHSPAFLHGDLYMPYAQSVNNERQLTAAMIVIVRAGAGYTGVPQRFRELVRSLNSNVPVSEIRTMQSLLEDSTKAPRSMMWLFVGFAANALVLAAIGTYGMMSYAIAQRSFEIGMRVALGASRSNIFGLVLGQSLRLVAAGLALGIVGSLAVTQVLSAFLYGTAARDPVTILAVCGLLVIVAFVAGLIPAQRAAGVDPLTALRAE